MFRKAAKAIGGFLADYKKGWDLLSQEEKKARKEAEGNAGMNKRGHAASRSGLSRKNWIYGSPFDKQ